MPRKKPKKKSNLSAVKAQIRDKIQRLTRDVKKIDKAVSDAGWNLINFAIKLDMMLEDIQEGLKPGQIKDADHARIAMTALSCLRNLLEMESDLVNAEREQNRTALSELLSQAEKESKSLSVDLDDFKFYKE